MVDSVFTVANELVARLVRLFRQDLSQSKWSFYLGTSVLVGVVAVIYRSARPTDASASAVGAGFALSGASLFLGLLLGFLFAIPKSSKNRKNGGSTDQSPESNDSLYLINSNLEEISDWLTKMLVGIGLIQLKQAPGYIRKISEYWETSIGHNFQSAYVSAVIIFFVVIGFLIGYLWTRLALIQDFMDRDPRMLEFIRGMGRIIKSDSTEDEIREESTRQLVNIFKSPSSGAKERMAAREELLTIVQSSGPVGIGLIAQKALGMDGEQSGGSKD